MKSRPTFAASPPVIWLVIFAVTGGCAPKEYARLRELGFTGAATNWRIVSAGEVGKTVGDQEVIDATGPLVRISPDYLNLSTQRISDRCIPAIVQVKSLEALDLSGTDVTADGLIQLAALPHLKKLFITEQNFRPDELQAVGNALPNVDIEDNWRGTQGRQMRDQNDGSPSD